MPDTDFGFDIHERNTILGIRFIITSSYMPSEFAPKDGVNFFQFFNLKKSIF